MSSDWLCCMVFVTFRVVLESVLGVWNPKRCAQESLTTNEQNSGNPRCARQAASVTAVHSLTFGWLATRRSTNLLKKASRVVKLGATTTASMSEYQFTSAHAVPGKSYCVSRVRHFTLLADSLSN